MDGRGRFHAVDSDAGLAEVDWLATHLGKVGGCDLRIRLCAPRGAVVDAALDGADAIVVDGVMVEVVRESLARGGRDLADVSMLVQPAANDVEPDLLAALDEAIALVLRAIREQSKGKAPPPRLAPPVPPPPVAAAESVEPRPEPGGAAHLDAEAARDEQRAWLTETLKSTLDASFTPVTDGLHAVSTRLDALAARVDLVANEQLQQHQRVVQLEGELALAVTEAQRRADGLATALAEIAQRSSSLQATISELGARVALHETQDKARRGEAQAALAGLHEHVDDRIAALALDVAGVHAAISALQAPLARVGADLSSQHALLDALGNKALTPNGLSRALAPVQAELALLKKVEGRSMQLEETVAGLTGFILELRDAVRPIESNVAALTDTVRGASSRVERVVQSSVGGAQRALEGRLEGACEQIGVAAIHAKESLEQSRATNELLASTIAEANQKRGWFR